MQPSLITVLQHPVAQEALLRMRNKDLSDADFRRETYRAGIVLAGVATEHLEQKAVPVVTPLAPTTGVGLKYRQALVPITRAGNGLLDAFLPFLPDALVWHVSISRNEETAQPEYHGSKMPKSVPDNIDVCFVLDPMLATAGTACLTVDLLKKAGAKKIIYVGVVGAPEGVERFHRDHPEVPIILIAIDEKLNEKFYIIPGLGDFGDREYPTV